MISIELNQKEGTYSRGTVDVKEEPYPVCHLFHRYIHKTKENKWKQRYGIKLSKSEGYFMQKYVLLYPRQHTQISLDSAAIYFNRYDFKNENPLVLVLFFEGSNSKEKKYYELSKFDSSQGTNVFIDTLQDYKDDVQLFPTVFRENREINKQITFRVGTSFGYSSVNQYEENIDKNFKRVTFMAKTTVDWFSRFNGKYELYSSMLLTDGKNRIDNQTIIEYDLKTFNSICVYYYTQENIALLIQLVDDFKLTHIRRKKSHDYNIWVTESHKIQYLCSDDLTNYLKIILHSLKNKIIVMLDKQVSYTDNNVVDSVTNGNTKTENGKTMNVTKGCNDESGAVDGYVCYKHDLKNYYNTNLRNLVDKLKLLCTFKFDLHVEVTFSTFNSDISLYDSNGSGKQDFFYKPGPGPPGNYVYVYFYATGGTRDKPDTVPLMLYFNRKFYCPKQFDYYFTGWNSVDENSGVPSSNVNSRIKSKLDELNKSLNRINLVKKSSYGLSVPTIISKTETSSSVNVRVIVKEYKLQDFRPFDTIRSDTIDCEYGVYSKYVHSTVNKLQLGPIEYQGKEINVKEEKKTPPTNVKVEVKPEQNQLTVYSVTKDKSSKFPLLIGIGKQEDSKPNQQGKVDEVYKMVSNGSSYKWQKLESDKANLLSDGSNTSELVKLLDEINYPLKKSAKIEISKRRPYELKGAPITSSQSFSSINSHYVKPSHNHVCEQLWYAGYRVYCHNISNMKGFDYGLIGSLKFYIPDQLPIEKSYEKVPNTEITLYKIKDNKEEIREKIINGTSFNEISTYIEKYEPIYYSSCKPEVYVYFYRADPRPGLLCFGNMTYKPLQMPQLYSSKYDYKDESTKWVGIRRTKICVCENPEELKFLIGLLNGLYFSSQLEKFVSEHWLSLSVGAGGGVVGVGSVAGGGYFLYSYIAGLQFLI